VLVTPEGITSETKALFTFAYKCAQRLPSYSFILRSHPELPISKAIELLPVDIVNQPNIVMSDKKSIDEDFGRASVLMYRGSSSVLYAILNGLLPIYVHVDTMVDTDPLYMLESWRKLCSTSDEFADLLERYERTPVEQLETEWCAAANYVMNYTVPVEEYGIEQFLAAVGIEMQMR